MATRTISLNDLCGGRHRCGDEQDLDPRKSGILHSTNCRQYRQKLRASSHRNLLNGLMVCVGLVSVMMVIILQSVEHESAVWIQNKIKATITTHLATLSHLLQGGFHFVSSGFVGNIGVNVDAAASENSRTSAREYYCNQNFNTHQIFDTIRKQVLNQDDALIHMEQALSGDSKFKSLAIFGPSGVGKTLTMMLLRQSFPWPENVHAYSWSTYVPDGARKFHIMRQFVDQLSDCGQNLLILDNLSTCDYSIVSIYNKLLVEREGDREEFNVGVNEKVIVVYIFNLDMEHYEEQVQILEQLPSNTTTISFRAFGRTDLVDCLKSELELEHRKLTERSRASILNEVDVRTTGCKSLRDLILQYGWPTEAN